MTELSLTGAAPDTRMFGRLAVAGSCAGFVVIGALQALYGPAIPALRARFGLGPSAAGLALSVHFAGALLGVLIFHWALGRRTDRFLLGSAYALMAAGSLLVAAAGAWPVVLAGALIVGLGFGGIDYGLNRLFAVGFGGRSAAMLNLLNAQFGVGAIGGPALLGRLGAGHYPWVFAAAAGTCLLLLPTLTGVRPRDRFVPERGTEPAPADAAVPATPAAPRVLPLVTAFVAINVLHVAIETGVGGWEPTHLEVVGLSASAAATATAAYWLAMTAGRFLAIPLSLRFAGPAIVTWCCAAMVGCLLLAGVPGAAPYAYAGVGLAIGPIFPTALTWLYRAAPGMAGAGVFVLAASMVGGIAFPPLLGGMIEWVGVGSVPFLLAGFAAACVALSGWLLRTTAIKAGDDRRGAQRRAGNFPEAG